MKLNVLWEIKLNEVEALAFVSMVTGFIMFVIGAGWDYLAGIQYLAHHQGYGWRQVLWMGFWGVYSVWAYAIMNAWSEK